MQFRTSVLDATRMSHGTLVYLKRTPSDSPELQVASYLSSELLRLDPRNHCVPLLDILQDPLNPDTAFMVMPFLRYITSPPFEVVGDILACIDQILEVRPPNARRYHSPILVISCRDLYFYTITKSLIGTFPGPLRHATADRCV